VGKERKNNYKNKMKEEEVKKNKWQMSSQEGAKGQEGGGDD
jgi:hypothetical protein